MSAIACFMTDRGHLVAGSDRAFDRDPSHHLIKILKSKGISIAPQDGSGIDRSFDLIVFSTAVEPDRPEMTKARALGISTKTRPEYLAEIVKEFRTIAVAGTSGKSTASGILAFAMQRLGLKPNFIGGGRVKQFLNGMNPGNALAGDSNRLVVEACESDGTIVNYSPLHSIILNLDLDHHPVDKTAGMFKALIGNTSGRVIVNNDDPNLLKLGVKNAVTFSVDSPSSYKASDIVYRSFGTDFSVRGTRFSLPVPGRYNVHNALSCIAVLDEMGVPLKDIAAVLQEFGGIERRFDVILDDGRKLVIDDYAHNPHKIASLMEAVRNVRERVCYIFQPHGFGPTKMMKKEYIESFTENLRDSDHLILLPIFYAGGTADKSISSRDLVDGIRAGGRSVEAVEGRKAVLDRAGEWEAYAVLGARDHTLSEFARDIAKRLNTGQG